MRRIQLRNSQQGIGLVEVMVALLLLAIAVLGFTAMQMTAVKATDESLLRTRALTVMRGGAEMMRANPDGITAFKTAINGTGMTLSNTDTGGVTITPASCMPAGTPASCTINQLAVRDALALKTHANNNDMRIGMVTCPGTADATTAQPRQCMIASWGTTTPDLDDGISTACGKTDGTYKIGAQCFIMEAY